MPKLSILVPSYNRAEYLRECLDSMLVTTADCEIIVSDNCSTDHTEEVMRAYTDPRIRYFRQATNIGGTENHNFLLAKASGDYICLFGDDDRALPGCFERKVELLDGFPQIDLVYSRAIPIDPQGRQVITNRRVMGHLDHSYIGGRFDFNDFLLNCFISWQTLVFRRTVLEAVGPLQEWGLQASIDWYWLQQCVRDREVAYIHEPTVEIRSHPGSFSISTAINEGYFMRDRMKIWRKWLLEADNPPILSDMMWERMVRVVTMDVQDVYAHDAAKRDEALLELSKLSWAYSKRMEARFEARMDVARHFRPGLAPWPLEGPKDRVFLYAPNWASPGTEDVIGAYARAFAPTDDVTLAIWLDPAQGVPLEEAAERVLGAVQAAGVNPEACADLLLVPDALDGAELARLYTAADYVVGRGELIEQERAERLGKPCLTALTPEAWHAAAGGGKAATHA